jgi:transposase
VLTLGYSRKCIRLLTLQSSSRIGAKLHERVTFRKLGGAVKIVVPDNLGEGVLKPDIYDATLNPLYRGVLAHYGAVAEPCRVADPDALVPLVCSVNGGVPQATGSHAHAPA